MRFRFHRVSGAAWPTVWKVVDPPARSAYRETCPIAAAGDTPIKHRGVCQNSRRRANLRRMPEIPERFRTCETALGTQCFPVRPFADDGFTGWVISNVVTKMLRQPFCHPAEHHVGIGPGQLILAIGNGACSPMLSQRLLLPQKIPIIARRRSSHRPCIAALGYQTSIRRSTTGNRMLERRANNS